MQGYLDRIGWTQAHFARLVGVSTDTVNDWCKGRTEGPGYQVGMRYLDLISRVLGV